MDCLDLLAVQGTLRSLLQHHSSKASILQHSTFFIVQLSHPYMTTGKTIQYHSYPSLCPNQNAEEVEQFYEDLQDLLELTPPKDVLIIIGDWNAKVESQETPGC